MPRPLPDHGKFDAGAGGMDHAGGWKASQYTAALGSAILARLGAGETIAELCADPEMPCAATLHRWRHMHPGFGAAYERMRDRASEYRRMHARLKRERWLEWARIEAKIGRRRTRTWVSGRKSTYERGWAKAFCAKVAKGRPVYRVCAEPGMPSSKAVYGWVKRHSEFAAMFVKAKADGLAWLQFQAEMAADRALDGAMSFARFRTVKQRVARIEGRIGRLRAKTYR